MKREKVGSPIPGSKFIRDYCRGCGEPIRVYDVRGGNTCKDCRGTSERQDFSRASAACRVERQKSKLKHTMS